MGSACPLLSSCSVLIFNIINIRRRQNRLYTNYRFSGNPIPTERMKEIKQCFPCVVLWVYFVFKNEIGEFPSSFRNCICPFLPRSFLDLKSIKSAEEPSWNSSASLLFMATFQAAADSLVFASLLSPVSVPGSITFRVLLSMVRVRHAPSRRFTIRRP